MKKYLLLLLLASCTHFSPKQSSKVFALIGFSGGGTGFLVKAPSGITYILTNKHVCAVAFMIVVPHTDGKELVFAKQLERADDTDLCIIRAPKELGEGISIAESEPQAHEIIHVIGQGLLLGNTLTEGHWVGRVMQEILGVKNPAYATAHILPGNSGSPVINEDGELVGVIYASSQMLDNRSLIVPLDEIKAFLKDY